jgi:Zn-dependent peptidase ImmA (M78 family)
VAGPLYEVLTEAARFLAGRAPASIRLRKLVENIEAIKTRGSDERLALQAGLATDPAEALTQWGRVVAAVAGVRDEVRQAILGTEESPLAIEQPCHAVLMFGSVSPTVGAEDVRTLAERLADLYAPGGESEELERVQQDVPVHDSVEPPWEQGQRLADEVLQELSLLDGDADAVDVEQVLAQLGVRRDEIALQDKHVRGVAIAGPDHSPTVLSNRSHPTYEYPSGQRFTLAHELCHILFDRAYGRRLALASGPWAPRDVEKRANAFAAMLLMPPKLIGKCIRRLTEPITEKDGVLSLARTLGASFTATIEHLCNLRFIDEVDRDRLRAEADPRA